MSEISSLFDCWDAASRYLSRGDDQRAMEICSGELCADILECQNYLGWLYYKRGDMPQASQWFFRASEKGDANAVYGIACVRYAEGNHAEALGHFKNAADKGCTRAFHWIGYIYHKGLSVPVDKELATSFYKKGAASGYLIAQHALLRLTFQAPGLTRKVLNFPKFIFLILKTAYVSRNINDPKFADFMVLGPSINFKHSNENQRKLPKIKGN